MYRILKDALESFASLKNYYNRLLPEIRKDVLEARRKYELGHKTDTYFRFLIIDTKAETDENLAELRNFVENHVEIISIFEKDGIPLIKYKVKSKENLKKQGIEIDIKLASTLYYRSLQIPFIHANNVLISLIIRFEEFISNVFYSLFSKYPSRYLDEQKVTFSEIKTSGLDEIQDMIIRKQIDAKMRESFTEWFKIFAEHKFDLSNCEKCMKKMQEIYSRRNIIVHNSGIVNKVYLDNNKETKYKLGDKLYADTVYLKEAFAVIKTIIFSISIEAVKIQDSTVRAFSISQIFASAYEALQDKEYLLCKNVFKKIEASKYATAQDKVLSKINYWIACDRLGEHKQIEKEIKDFDTSAFSKQYAFAKHILLKEYDLATDILNEMFRIKEISTFEINDWPLLSEYRETEQFRDFRQRNKDEFDISTVEVTDSVGTEYETEDDNQNKEVIAKEDADV